MLELNLKINPKLISLGPLLQITMGLSYLLVLILRLALADPRNDTQVTSLRAKVNSFTLSTHHWVISLDHSLTPYYYILATVRTEISTLYDNLKTVRLQSLDDNIFAVNSHIKDLVVFELSTLNRTIDFIYEDLANVKLCHR
jgi:hypothetical protein